MIAKYTLRYNIYQLTIKMICNQKADEKLFNIKNGTMVE